MTRDSGLLNQLIKYGVKRIVFSVDFIFSFVVCVLLFLGYQYKWGYFSPVDKDGLVYVVTIAAAMFSVLVTALAIILSFSSSNFIKFLRKHGKYEKVLFYFWYTSIVFLGVIGLSLVQQVLVLEGWDALKHAGHALILAAFIYGIINVFYVLDALVRFSYFLGQYEDNYDKK